MKTEQKIRALVPSLQELTFGCEVKVEIGTIVHGTSRTPNIKKFMVFRNTIGDNVYVTSGYDYSREINRKDIVEILGNPIQLHHVLQAIDKCISPFEDRDYDPYVHTTGHFSTKKGDLFKWDLTKDYHNQSEEVKEFIGSLLK